MRTVKQEIMQEQLAVLILNKLAMSSVVDFETALDWAVFCQRLSRFYIRGSWGECAAACSFQISAEVDVDRIEACRLCKALDSSH